MIPSTPTQQAPYGQGDVLRGPATPQGFRLLCFAFRGAARPVERVDGPHLVLPEFSVRRVSCCRARWDLTDKLIEVPDSRACRCPR